MKKEEEEEEEKSSEGWREKFFIPFPAALFSQEYSLLLRRIGSGYC